MIHFYYGDNGFGLKRQVDAVTAKFAEKYGTENIGKINSDMIDPQNLMAEIVNINLFMPNRLMVLDDLSINKIAWEALRNCLSRIPDETDLIIVESKPDKRTKTFKELKKVAKCREFLLPKNNDLTEFVLREAADNRVEIKRDAVNELIIYTGGDPWRIVSEIAKFQALDKVVTSEIVRTLVEPELEASAFQLLDDLLAGRNEQVMNELAKLRQVEDAGRFLGLLASQIFALSTAINSERRSSGEVATEMGVHPFVMSKMFTVARRIKTTEIAHIAELIAEADAKMKSTGADPWTLIELTLRKI